MSSSPPPKTDYTTILIAYMSFVVLGLPSAMLGIAWASDKWPSIQKTFSLSLDSVGALLLAFTIGYSLTSFLGGRLYGQFKSSTLFLIGSLLSATALFGYSISPTWWLIVACGTLLGLGSGVLDSGMNIYFAAIYNARLMNWLHACFGIGTVIGPLLMTTILSINGGTWQTGFLIGAVAYALAGLLFLLTRSRWVNGGTRDKQGGNTIRGLSSIHATTAAGLDQHRYLPCLRWSRGRRHTMDVPTIQQGARHRRSHRWDLVGDLAGQLHHRAHLLRIRPSLH